MSGAGKRVGKLGLLTALILAAVPTIAAEGPPFMVGRVAYVDGDLLRYVPADDDWVAAVADIPMGPKDVFYSDQGGRAEFAFPNRTLARVGAATQVEVVGIERDLTDINVGSGQIRLYNRGSGTYFRISTPFGYVVAPSGARADLYVGDESVEVISLGGTVQFVQSREGGYESNYDVTAGGPSLLANREDVGSGDGSVDADWDRWNAERDTLLARRTQARSQYLPAPLQDESYALEENGRWEQVQYEGSQRYLWRPTSVAAGWSPFTVGRWTTWHEDEVWVPYEPFGYVTHHYGNWVLVGGGWYWMPPAYSVVAAGGPPPPLYWYPGRVAWISGAAEIGWVPLAPAEPYYGHHSWGPGVTVIAGGVAAAAITIGTLAYLNHAVCVPYNRFWGVPYTHGAGYGGGYSSVRITNINKTTIINNFQATPAVHQTVVKHVTNTKSRYNFVNKEVAAKPHQSVAAQIKERQKVGKPVTTSALTTNLQKAPKGQIAAGKRIQEPKITNKVVKASDVNKPQAQFQEVKPKAKAEKPQIQPATGTERKEGPPETMEKPGVTETPPKGVRKPPPAETMEKPGVTETPPKGVRKPPPAETMEKPGVTETPPKGMRKAPPAETMEKPGVTETPPKGMRKPPPAETMEKPGVTETPPKSMRKPPPVETMEKPGVTETPPKGVRKPPPETGIEKSGQPPVKPQPMEKAVQPKPPKEPQGEQPQTNKSKQKGEKEQQQ